MSYCGEQTAVKREGKQLTAVSLRCRSWTCPECRQLRQRQLIAEANGGTPNTFLTLTNRRVPDKTPIDAARELAKAWRLVRLRIMRRYKFKRLPFIAVFEPHASGWPHLHILMRSGFIDWGWLSAQMRELLNSPHVDIRRIDNRGRVSAYVAKYCAKGTTKFGTCKRYWCSQDYDTRQPQDDDTPRKGQAGWRVELQPLARILNNWTECGFIVRRVSQRVAACIILTVSEQYERGPP